MKHITTLLLTIALALLLSACNTKTSQDDNSTTSSSSPTTQTVGDTSDTGSGGSSSATGGTDDSTTTSGTDDNAATPTDVTPPVIVLNGEANITLEQNAVYTELGATALDGVDGNVSVSISGTVDTSTVGNYTVTYTATDSAGNKESLKRHIHVITKQVEDMGYLVESNETEAGNKPSTIQLSVNLIYDKNLTFDLKQLQVCNDKRCWGIVESVDNVNIKTQNKKSTLIANKLKVVNLGLFDIFTQKKLEQYKHINTRLDTADATSIELYNRDLAKYNIMIKENAIDRIKYIYNGERGEAELPTEMLFSSIGNSLYIKLDRNVTVPFNDRYFPQVNNKLYVPSYAHKYKFDNGVILDIPRGALNQMAYIVVKGGKGWKEELEYFEFSDYRILFYGSKPNATFEEINQSFESGDILNTVPKYFAKKIGVYLPLKKTNISKEELLKAFKFSNGNNQGYTEDFEIVTVENKTYVYFETNLTAFNPGFDSK